MERSRGLSERLYAALLRGYPRPFRDRFASEMVQLFADQLRDARARGGVGGVVVTWFRSLGDLAATAIAERIRSSERVGRSLEPTPLGIRGLGLLGVIAGVVLLATFVVDIDPGLNNIRLLLFYLGSVAVALALHRRQSVRAPGLSLVVATAVVVANAWNIGMLVLAIGRPVFPEPDPAFRLVGFYAEVAMWLADAALGLVAFRLRTAPRWAALALALGSVVGMLGIDRFELVRGDYAWLFSPLALAGIGLAGIAWVLLGASLLRPHQIRIEDTRA